MKSIIVAALLCFLAFYSDGAYMNRDVKYAEAELLEKQKFILDILQHVYQDESLQSKWNEGKSFSIPDHYDDFREAVQVKEFYKWHLKDPVPLGDIFTLFKEQHLSYARKLIGTLFEAKDWDTFHKTVLWARFHVNKEVFIYALSFVVIHREDLQGIVLPTIYEIQPHYFFSTETIQKAQYYKMKEFDGIKEDKNVLNVFISSNYSRAYDRESQESFLSYFTEDIGLNAFYYYYNLDYPFYLSGPHKTAFLEDRRGEFYLSVHQQLLARYALERLSNDLPEIEEFFPFTEKFPGYTPNIRYYSGTHFPGRASNHYFYHSDNYYNMDMIDLYGRRIMNAIDYQCATLPDGSHFKMKDIRTTLETLGNMLQGTKDSVNRQVYGSLDHILRNLINDGSYISTVPGVMHHFQTSIRDPAFFSMYKYILRFYWHYMEQLPPYTKDELKFDGVKIKDAKVDKLVTYFDTFDADITNAVDIESYDENTDSELHKFGRLDNHNGHDFIIKARQLRLNHLPFTFKLTVSSSKAQKATIKAMIGLKIDFNGREMDINENRKNFFELDYFLVDLVEGENVITRSSSDFSWYVNDRTTYYELYRNVFKAIKSGAKFSLDMSEAHCGFPSRLMLPKGKKGGMLFQMFFFVGPYHEPEVPQFTGYDPTISCGVGSGARYLDETTFSFPVDRVIDKRNWYFDNMYYLDTMVYHKPKVDIDIIRQ